MARPYRIGAVLRCAVLSVLVVGPALIVALPRPPAAVADVPPQTYLLRQPASDFCVAVNRAQSGQPAMLADCVSLIDRAFRMGFADGSGRHSLNLLDNVCLQMAGKSVPGSSAYGKQCTGRGDLTQMWGLPPVGQTGSVTHHGFCLTTNRTDRYALLSDALCDPAMSTQRWTLVATAGPPTVLLRNRADFSCANIDPTGARVVFVVDCRGVSSSGRFFLLPMGSAYLFLTSDALCLAVADDSIADGAAIVGRPCTGSTSQIWSYPTDRRMINEHSSQLRAFDVCMGTLYGPGDPVEQDPCPADAPDAFHWDPVPAG